MGKTMKILVMAVLLALGVAAGSAVADPNLVQNGQFLDTSLSSPGGYVCDTVASSCTSGLTYWGSECSSTGQCGNSNTVLSLLFAGTGGSAFNGNRGMNVTLPDSPDGGNIIAGDGDGTYRASIYQLINGLTVGTTYDVTFYQAAAEQAGFDSNTIEQWQVSLGSETQDSPLMTTPAGTFSPWTMQSLTFVATATSEYLNFLALGRPAADPPVSLLADVSLTEVEVAEPGTLALVATGLFGLVTTARLRGRRKL